MEKNETKYIDKYYKLRDEIWTEFENLVRKGAIFDYTVEFKCPRGVNPIGGTLDTEGDSWFKVTEIVADPEYKLHVGTDLMVGTSQVTIIFGKKKRKKYTIAPDIFALDWLCEMLDSPKH